MHLEYQKETSQTRHIERLKHIHLMIIKRCKTSSKAAWLLPLGEFPDLEDLVEGGVPCSFPIRLALSRADLHD